MTTERMEQFVAQKWAELLARYPWEKQPKVKTGRGGRRKRRARRVR